MKSLLSLVYAARAVAVLVFLLSPKTATTMLIFAAVMGLTYLSTVPPTAGLVAKFFGPANMNLEPGRLQHQLPSRSGKAQQQFAKTNNTCGHLVSHAGCHGRSTPPRPQAWPGSRIRRLPASR